MSIKQQWESGGTPHHLPRIFVGAEGLEKAATVEFTADRDELASLGHARVDVTARHEEAARPGSDDPDEALRAAIGASLRAGDFARVKALVAVLESSAKP